MDVDAGEIISVTFSSVMVANLFTAMFAYGAFFYTWHEKHGTENEPGTGKYFACFSIPIFLNAALALIAFKGWGPDALRTPFMTTLSQVMMGHFMTFMFGFGAFSILRRIKTGRTDNHILLDAALVIFPLFLFAFSFS